MLVDNAHILVPYSYRSELIEISKGLSKNELKKLIREKIRILSFNEKYTITFINDDAVQIIELDLRQSIDFNKDFNLIPIFSLARKIAEKYEDCMCIVYINALSCVVTIKNGFVIQYSKVDDILYEAESYIKRAIKFNMSNNERSIILSDVMIDSLDIEKINFDEKLIAINEKNEKINYVSSTVLLTRALKKKISFNFVFLLVLFISTSHATYTSFIIKNEMEMLAERVVDRVHGINYELKNQIDDLYKRAEAVDLNVKSNFDSINKQSLLIESTKRSSVAIEEDLQLIKLRQQSNSTDILLLKSAQPRNLSKKVNYDYKFELKMVVEDTAVIKVMNNNTTKLVRISVGETMKLNSYVIIKLVNVNRIDVEDSNSNKVYSVDI